MIIATVTTLIILFGGGGGFSFGIFKGPVKEVVQDKDRREVVLQSIEDADGELESFNDHRKNSAAELKELIRNPATTREDLRAFAARAGGRRSEMQSRLLDLRFQAKSVLTADEWRSIYGLVAREKSKE